MNMLIIAAIGVLPVVGGEQNVAPQHVVAIQANSTQASGTLKMESIVSYTTESETVVATTNVVRKGQSIEKRDAYVGTDLVYYGGSAATAWSSSNKTVTNIVGTVTNVVTFKESTLADGLSTKGVWTNVATRIRQRYETASSTVTNVTTRSVKTYDVHPVTNVVLDATLSGGKYSSVTNLYIPGGILRLTGTALTNAVISVFTEK